MITSPDAPKAKLISGEDCPPAIYRIVHWQSHCGASPALSQIGRGPFRDTSMWLITTSGMATIDLNGPRFVLEPGSILPLRSAEHSRPAEIIHRDNWSYLLICLSGSLSRLYFDYLNNEYGFSNGLPLDSEPITLANQIAQEFQDFAHFSPHHWSDRAHLWLSAWDRYLKAHRLPLSSVLDIQKGDPAIMEFASRSVKEIIQATGCSRTMISRRFRSKWGMPLAELLHLTRMYWAMLYLQDPAFKVREVSLKIGYCSLSAFINAFKKATGCTPLQYRHGKRAKRLAGLDRLGLAFPSLAALKQAIKASKAARTQASQPEAPSRAMEVNNAFERRSRPARPYFSIGLFYQRDTISAPIDMSLEPFRKKCFFTYTVQGSAVMQWNNQKRVLRPGDLIVHQTPIKLTYSPNGRSEDWIRYTIALFGQPALHKCEAVMAAHGCFMQLPPDSKPIVLMRRIVESLRHTFPVIDRSSQVYEFLSGWHEYLDTNGNPSAELVNIENCESKIIPYHTVKSVKDLAREVGYSRSHFSRKLRKQWQTATPGSIIRSGKLATASKLLRDTDMPIGQIATKVGYSSVAGFIGAFKRIYHQTPLRYRRLPE